MSDEIELFDWEARRSGYAITVTGRNAAGELQRHVVSAIEALNGQVVATSKLGKPTIFLRLEGCKAA